MYMFNIIILPTLHNGNLYKILLNIFKLIKNINTIIIVYNKIKR